MSQYINPKDKSPVDWLLEHGHFVYGGSYSDPLLARVRSAMDGAEYYYNVLDTSKGPFWDNKVFVCVYVNPSWNAAAVCFSRDEVEKTFDLEDPRDHIYFIVDKKKAMAEIRPYQRRQIWI